MATLATSIATSDATAAAAAAVILPDEHDGTTVSHSSLHALVGALQQRLAAFGVGAQHAVSLALPNGAEFVVAFLAVAAQRAVAAPLNPAYTQAEFEFFIADVQSVLVVVPRGAVAGAGAAGAAPVVRAATRHGAAVAEVWWEPELGQVQMELVVPGRLLSPPSGDGRAAVLTAQPEDVALVLHTSGTTGRPKAVPLTHRNLTRTMGVPSTVQLVERGLAG